MSSSSSWSSKLHYNFGSVSANRFNVLDKSSVTQATSITTGVTLGSLVGTITTVNAAIATFGNATFTATHPSINMNSIVFTSIGAYSGNGIPSVRVLNQTQGSCQITIHNSHNANPTNAAVTIAYNII